MNPVRVARLLGRLLAVVVLVVSGAYFIVYLYRWEWNRAQVSGVVFVATEVAVVGSVVLRRLQQIEHDVARRGDRAVTQDPTAAASGGPEPAEGGTPRFRWLEPDRTAVFIPVLLGAGAILAALAYVVERIASFVAGGTDPHPSRLRRLAYPEPARTTPGTAGARPARRPLKRVATVMAALLVAAATVTGVKVLADATMSRPDPANLPGVTEVTIRFGYRVEDPIPVEDSALALFEACRLRLPSRSRLVGRPELVRHQTVTIQVAPALGELGRRRLHGCIEDYTLDGVAAYVEGMRQVT